MSNIFATFPFIEYESACRDEDGEEQKNISDTNRLETDVSTVVTIDYLVTLYITKIHLLNIKNTETMNEYLIVSFGAILLSQPAFTCSKLTIETLTLLTLLTLNIFHTLF